MKFFVMARRSFLLNFLMYRLHRIMRIAGFGYVPDTQFGFKLLSRVAGPGLFPR
jgi:hypothetical protein